MSKKFAGMFVAGILALTMGVSAVAAPCAAIAQEAPAQEQVKKKYTTADEAKEIALAHAHGYWGITPDKVYDLKVSDENVQRWTKYGDDYSYAAYYEVSFWSHWRSSRPLKRIYQIRLTDGGIITYCMTEESLYPK